MPSLLNALECLDCGWRMAPDPLAETCAQCGSPWLDAQYDYASAGAAWRGGLSARVTSLWRYGELLPVAPRGTISMSEGWTPLIPASGLGRELEHSGLWIKDERRLPTANFKDRQAALAVMHLLQRGIDECVVASAGNKAAAYAAFCARAGIRLWVFLTSSVPAEKLRELALYGVEVVKVTGTYEQTKQIAADFAARRGLYYDPGTPSVLGRESYKTIAYEIAEQLARLVPAGTPWHAPDWYVQAVSGGIGPLGVWKGFHELWQMGLIDRLPRLALVQSAGCAPMAAAWEAGQAVAEPVVAQTRISVLATADPGRAYPLLREACLATGGTMIAIPDGEAFRAMRRLARSEGISMEPAAALAFAGLEHLLARGNIDRAETVVVNCSGHTFPAEKHILEDQYVLDLEFAGAEAGPGGAPLVEGLGVALEHLDEGVTTIVVIDDNPQDSRLIHRLLQAHKNYRVFEVNDPREGLDTVRQRRPDLIVLDLMMPDLDGFTLLALLKDDPQVAHIPVVVVSAKTLTPADRARLEGMAESLWQKGGFNTRELVEHVVSTLGGSPAETPAELTLASEGQVAAASKERIAAEPPAPRDIVVVDDEPRDARLIRRLLEATGRYRVIEAHDGESGWAAILHWRPALVVMDLMLPDISGEALLERLHADPRTADIPVVVLTAKDLRRLERERLLGQIISLFQKATLDRQALVASVDKTLGGR
jgi:threonine synthase